MFARLVKAIGLLNRLTAVVGVALLVALVIIAAMQVFYRYVLLEPLIWSEEAARYLLIWLSFVAAGLLVRENGNPRVEIVPLLLRQRNRAMVDLAIKAVIAGFLLVFIWISWSVALRYGAFVSLGTGISQAVPRMALPIGGLLMLVNLLPAVLEDIAALAADEDVSA